MGEYVSRHFTAGWKKVGTFTIHTPPNGAPTKLGGNVVAYFLTPEKRVIHVVFGNVDVATFIEGARWAVKTWKEASSMARDRRSEVVRLAHEKLLAELMEHAFKATSMGPLNQESLSQMMGRTRSPWSSRRPIFPVHRKLATEGLPRLDSVYRYFFENLVGETVSDDPVRYVSALFRAPNASGNLWLPRGLNRR